MKELVFRQLIREEIVKILNEAQNAPKTGDTLILTFSSGFESEIQVQGNKVKVDNRGKAPKAIIAVVPTDRPDKKWTAKKYKDYFYVDINNLKPTNRDGVWTLKNTKKAIDGKDLKFVPFGRGTVLPYVETR